MQNKAIILGLLGVSAAAVAADRIVPLRGGMATSALAQASLLPPAVSPQPQAAPAPAPYAAANISQAISSWHSLRQSDRLPFSSYAAFLTRYRGWPGETGLRRSAERAIDLQAGSSPAQVVAYFRIHPPLTNTGGARHALALQGAGQPDLARAAAREAWRAGDLLSQDEGQLLTFFGGTFTSADHDARIEALLDSGDGAQRMAAMRLLSLASPARRPFYETRIALQTRTPDADSRLSMLGEAANGDPGILMDRANALRNAGQPATARALLARSRTLTSRPSDPEKWFETMLVMARASAADRQWSMAYQIASQLDDAYPAGTDVSARPYGERDDYTSLAWLAGSTALHELRRPQEAMGMFDRYARAAKSPQTQSKGWYWAGRAAVAAGDAARANAYFQQASAWPDQFYGQLSLERLGRTVPAPPPAPQVTATNLTELAEATRALGLMGRREDQTLFVRALAESASSTDERHRFAELGRQIGRPDVGVWIARSARSDGGNYYERPSFPEVPMPPAYVYRKTLSHAIMRQESSFDRTAVSHAGARGMMQLMPGTANEVSRRLGLGYSRDRLTGDPQYNIMLGSAYFGQLMDRYNNYAPLAVAAYNAGPGNVNKWLAANGDPRLPSVDVTRWIEEIPFFETRNYVQRVLENAVVYDAMDTGLPPAAQRNRLSWYLGKANQPG